MAEDGNGNNRVSIPLITLISGAAMLFFALYQPKTEIIDSIEKTLIERIQYINETLKDKIEGLSQEVHKHNESPGHAGDIAAIAELRSQVRALSERLTATEGKSASEQESALRRVGELEKWQEIRNRDWESIKERIARLEQLGKSYSGLDTHK